MGGGIARPYHFAAVFIVLLLASVIPRLLASSVFLLLLLFVVVNIFTAAFSSAPGAAFASLTSFLANVAVAMAAAMILLSRRLRIDQLFRLVMIISVVSVCLAIIQMVAAKAGLILALSPQQEGQIAIGFGPAFRTEANTFGKFLTLPFMLCLPFYLRNSGDRSLRVFMLALLAGILISFTRSAIFGLLVGFLFAVFWYAKRGRLSMIALRMMPVMIVSAIAIGLAISGALGVSDYAIHKIMNFFNSEEIFAGGSSAYRIEAMNAVINKATSDSKYLFLGDGWGQTYAEVQGLVVQAGGGDLVNILGASGLLGVIVYLVFYLTMLRSLWRTARSRVR